MNNQATTTLSELAHPEGLLASYNSRVSFDINEQSQRLDNLDIRLTQLVAGEFHGTLESVTTPNMTIYEDYWGCKAQAIGVAPVDSMVIGTRVERWGPGIQWCGESIDHRHFGLSEQGGSIDYVLPSQSSNAVLVIKSELLRRTLSQDAYNLLLGSRTITFTLAAGTRLVTAITETVRKYARFPELLENPWEVRALESSLLDILGSALERSANRDHARSASSRRCYVRKAIAQVENTDVPLTSLELAQAIGVSQRTLNYAFREVLEVTPNTYLQLHRLNAAHRDLIRIGPQSTASVSEIACKWGFVHPGRFSILHNKLFNEKPSVTLRRPRLPGGGLKEVDNADQEMEART